MPEGLNDAKCLVCHAPALPKETMSASEISAAYEDEFGYRPPQLSQVSGFVLFHCAQCQLEFFKPGLTGDAAFYDWVGTHGHYAPWRWEFGPILELAKSCGGTIVEVGAGSGQLTRALLQLGVNVVAVEPSAVAREGLSRFEGVTTLSDINQVLERDLRADLVVSCHVLEHVSDPMSFLTNLKAAARIGGHLAVSVPQYMSLIRPRERLEAFDCPPHHVTRWTSSSLDTALRRINLANVDVIREPMSNYDAAQAISIMVTGRDRRWARGPLNRSGLSRPIGRVFGRRVPDAWAARNIIGFGTKRTE